MKKLFFAFFTGIIFSLCFLSCAMETSPESSSRRQISVNVFSLDSSVSFSPSSSRTVMPSSLSGSSLDFYIMGDCTTDYSSSISLQKINVTGSDSTKGTFTFSFEPLYYRLFLYAVSKGSEATVSNIENIALLKASSAVDLRTNDEINFYLSPYTVYGSGDFTIKIYADGWICDTSVYNITFEASEKASSLAAKTDAYSTTVNQRALPTDSAGAVEFTTGGTSIDAGTYLLKIIFSDASNHVYTYCENMVILPHQTTTGTVIVPDIIGRAPDAPTFLTAGYCDNPSTSSFDLYYPVEFLWDDNSYNELDFELELMDISGLCGWDKDSGKKYYYNTRPGTALYPPVPMLLDSFDGAGQPTLTTAEMNDWWALVLRAYGTDEFGWNCGVTSKTYVRSKFSETNLTDVNWTRGDYCYALLRLVYGKTYLARIRAVNDSGESDWVYLDLSNKGRKAFVATSSLAAGAFSSFDANATGISRFRIFYNLDGGKYYDYDSVGGTYTDVNATVLASSAPAVATFTQKRSSYAAILSPVSLEYSAENYASLYYYSTSPAGYYLWQNWGRGEATSEAFVDSTSGGSFTYSGCDNLYLYAYYGTSTAGRTFTLRTTAAPTPRAPENADFTVSAHVVNSSMLGPFDTDTEDSNSANYAPISLVEGESFTVSKGTYGYLNFLINCSSTGAENIKVNVAARGVQGVTYSEGGNPYGITTTVHQTKTFKFCKINLSDYETGKLYNAYFTFNIEGTEYHYTLSFVLED